MAKKEHRSLEEILNSLKNAEKEFDEKLDKYGLKDVKPKKSDKVNENDLSKDTVSDEQQIDSQIDVVSKENEDTVSTCDK